MRGSARILPELLHSALWLARLLRFRLDSAARSVGGIDEGAAELELLVAELATAVGEVPGSPLVPPPLPVGGWLPTLSRLFKLDALEALLVVAGVSPTLDSRFAAALTRLRGGGSAPGRLNAEVLGQLLALTLPERLELVQLLHPQRRLEQLGLLQLDWGDSAPPLAGQPLEVPARLRAFLTDSEAQLPDLIRPLTRLRQARWGMADLPLSPGDRERVLHLADLISGVVSRGEVVPVAFMEGAPGGPHMEVAEVVAANAGLGLMEVDVDAVLFTPDVKALAPLLMREAILRRCALFLRLEHEDLVTASHYRRTRYLLEEELRFFSLPIFAQGNLALFGALGDLQRPALRFELKMPDRGLQKVGLIAAIQRIRADAPETTVDSVLNRYNLDHRVFDDIARGAQVVARSNGLSGDTLEVEHIERAIDLFLSRNLGSLSSRLSVRYGWDDLIVSAEAMGQLKALRYLIEYKHEVFEVWGLGSRVSGRGVKAIFTGPSGTGKTMGAEVIAGDLRLPLYRVDLSQIASKWLGETEKNIDRIFQEAQASQAMLLFDEADALFGKRQGDPDDGGGFGNLEVNFLLQRFETYDGVVILTSNFPQAIDDAFIRRMHFWVEFQLPDEEYRRKLWETTLIPTLPMKKDIDVKFLAQRFEFSGANIKNVVMSAAFLAASEDKVVGMSQIVRAIQWEYQKLGRSCSASDFGPYFRYLPSS